MATYRVTAGNRDAKEAAGVVVVTGNGADHDHDATNKLSGVTFVPSAGGNPAGPPQGATIDAGATLAVYISTTGADEPDVDIFGEKVVASAIYTAGTNDISNRVTNNPTTATVHWSSTDLGATANQKVTITPTTGSITAILQELVNQASWDATSPITFIFRGNHAGSAEPTARDLQYRFYEYTGAGGTDPAGTYAAELVFTWTGGAGGSMPVKARYYLMMGES